MKTWKQIIFVCLMVIFAFAFIACDEDEEKVDPCNCDPKAHLGIDEKCNCGGSTCSCSEQIAWFNDIKIRKAAGISNVEMTSIVDELILPAFNSDGHGYVNALTSEKLHELHLTNIGNVWVYDANMVLTINRNTITEIKDTMGKGMEVVYGLTSLLHNIATGMPPGYEYDPDTGYRPIP